MLWTNGEEGGRKEILARKGINREEGRKYKGGVAEFVGSCLGCVKRMC
jgi:hypothetical protein